MAKHSSSDLYKNAMGTVFLLAGAFFVCSTFMSMRAVFADPIAPTVAQPNNAGNAQVGRASPRGKGSATTSSNASAGRGVSARGVASRKNTNVNVVNPRVSDSRGVVARTAGNSRTVSSNRNVRARTADVNQTRVSLTGSAIRGSKTTSGTYYTYMSNKLYTGNYSNIIDSTTGLISADAYSNCVESYYTCMDEICTARNASQRRCACAGRVKSFAEAEAALESANEELIKVSGELALLIANKGKEVSQAFQLTDAEKVMNCVSWREASKNGTASADVFGDWCEAHGIFDNSCSKNTAPEYCYSTKNGGAFDVSSLNGSGSDILASLASWADQVKENTETVLGTNDDSVASAISSLTSVINGLSGTNLSITNEQVHDTLAETWGYDLFEYAHNNVCARVLDSCFNGIYEGCGTPPSGGVCANGASSSCPFNYNSKITVSSSGDVTLNERSKGTAATNASCFGYTNSSGDPYSSLRGPVADARRSVMQKYLLDANADCDAYGEQLKTTAQKITYQKVAAQQSLQQKRLEFANQETETILADAVNAMSNFNECISEIYDCYETQLSANASWTTARIKTYCAQISNVPHCYETMICNPSNASFKAVIDVMDKTSCNNSSDYTKNTCRNIVTLNDILNGTGEVPNTCAPDGTCDSSRAMRQQCLIDAIGKGDASGKKNFIETWDANTYRNNNQ